MRSRSETGSDHGQESAGCTQIRDESFEFGLFRVFSYSVLQNDHRLLLACRGVGCRHHLGTLIRKSKFFLRKFSLAKKFQNYKNENSETNSSKWASNTYLCKKSEKCLSVTNFPKTFTNIWTLKIKNVKMIILIIFRPQ